jgi:hypothetical protein
MTGKKRVRNHNNPASPFRKAESKGSRKFGRIYTRSSSGLRINISWGKHYDWLFENRQKADHRPLVEFDSEQVRDIIEQSGLFVKDMERLLRDAAEEPRRSPGF